MNLFQLPWVCLYLTLHNLRHVMQCLQKLEFNTNTAGLCSDVRDSRGHGLNKTKGVAQCRGDSHLPAAQSSKSTDLSRTFPSFTPSPPVTQRMIHCPSALHLYSCFQTKSNKQTLCCQVADWHCREEKTGFPDKLRKISVWGIRCQNDQRACG